MLHYEKVLGVDKDQAKVVRGDPPFIGRIMRRQVTDASFLTIDAIDVYLNEHVPPGMTPPLVRHANVLTRWDINSGLPVECTMLTRKTARTQWKPRVRPDSCGCLVALPIHGVARSFSYSTSRVECPMRHSNDKPFDYQQFIPKRSAEEEDDLLNAMPLGSPGDRPPPRFHH